MKLIWLDLETTGLDPNACDILEIAAVGASIENPTVTQYLINTPVWHGGGGLSKFIRRMHTSNGLLRECKIAPGLWTVGALFDDILREFIGDDAEKPMLAGASVHFDLGFLRRHLPYIADRLSHRVFDTSAITAFCASMGMPYPNASEPAHRAMYDIEDSIERYTHCRNWVEGRSK